MLQKKFGADYGHYRDSRVEGGKKVQGVSGSTQYYFSDIPLLADSDELSLKNELDNLIYSSEI